jgi:hypothetical protein
MQKRKLGKSNLEVSVIGLGKRSLSTSASASGGVRSFGFVRAQLMNLIGVEPKGRLSMRHATAKNFFRLVKPSKSI